MNKQELKIKQKKLETKKITSEDLETLNGYLTTLRIKRLLWLNLGMSFVLGDLIMLLIMMLNPEKWEKPFSSIETIIGIIAVIAFGVMTLVCLMIWNFFRERSERVEEEIGKLFKTENKEINNETNKRN